MKKQTLRSASGAPYDSRDDDLSNRRPSSVEPPSTRENDMEGIETPFLQFVPTPRSEPSHSGISGQRINPVDLFLQLHCLADYLAWEHDALPSEYRAVQASELLRSAIGTLGRMAADRQIMIRCTVGRSDTATIWDAFRLEKLFQHLLYAVVDAAPAGQNIHILSEGAPGHSNFAGAEQMFQLHIICEFPTDDVRIQSITRLETHRSFALAYHLNASMSGVISVNKNISARVIWRLQLPCLQGLATATGNIPDQTPGDSQKPSFPYMGKAHTAFLDDLYNVFEREIDNPDLDTETIARMLTMSRAKLHRRLTGLTGKSAHELLRDFRLERAMMLLRAGGCNVGETAWQTGFSNPKYFATAFRKKYGFSPSACLKDSKSNRFETKSSL